MASSGTYAFAPSLADLFIQAFGRCQIRRPQITAEHLSDAAMCANLLQVEFSNRQVNLWTVDLVTQVLTPEQTAYTLEARTIDILAAYISTGADPVIDRILNSVSRDDYAAFPDKTTPGVPTVYWLNRQATPVVTLWQPPDDKQTYTLKYYRAKQMQDATATGGLSADVPYRFLEAYTSALALKIARLYPPENPLILADLKDHAARSWTEAAQEDVESAPMMIVPALGSYYRGAA